MDRVMMHTSIPSPSLNTLSLHSVLPTATHRLTLPKRRRSSPRSAGATTGTGTSSQTTTLHTASQNSSSSSSRRRGAAPAAASSSSSSFLTSDTESADDEADSSSFSSAWEGQEEDEDDELSGDRVLLRGESGWKRIGHLANAASRAAAGADGTQEGVVTREELERERVFVDDALRDR